MEDGTNTPLHNWLRGGPVPKLPCRIILRITAIQKLLQNVIASYPLLWRPELRRAQMAEWKSSPAIATKQHSKTISRTHTIVKQTPNVNVMLDITEEKIGLVIDAIPVLCAMLTHIQLIHVFQVPQMILSSVFARMGSMVTVQHARCARSATRMRRSLSCARTEAWKMS
jgi:hypothetical protein